MTQEDLIKLERIRAIPDNAVKQLDIWTFEVESNDKRNQGEVNYMVYFSPRNQKYSCTCRDFLYRNTEEKPDYECKHIGKVRDMIIKRLSKK